MAEQYIKGAEYTVAVLDGAVLPAIELRTTHTFYDYDAKYIASDTQYLCPAPLSTEDTATLNALCLTAFSSLGCEGWAGLTLCVMRRVGSGCWKSTRCRA